MSSQDTSNLRQKQLSNLSESNEMRTLLCYNNGFENIILAIEFQTSQYIAILYHAILM